MQTIHAQKFTNMKTIGERLTYYIDYKGFTKKDFCEKANTPYNNFVRVLKNTRPLGMNVLMDIKKALPKLSVNWLLYGEGVPDIIEHDGQVNENAFAYELLNQKEPSELMKAGMEDWIVQIIKEHTDPRFKKLNEDILVLMKRDISDLKKKDKGNQKSS